MKSILSKMVRTVIFCWPFFYLLYGALAAQTLSLSTALSAVFLVAFLGLIWAPPPKPRSGARKAGVILLKVICYFAWLFVVLLALLNFDTRCTACEQITPFISDNGVVFDLDKGHTISQFDSDGWQSCGCRLVISFENDPYYPMAQIVAMGNYWTKHTDCSAVLQKYAPDFYEVDFDTVGSCFIHTSADRLIIYNPRTHRLFYGYNAS